ncbi:hypothetical protein [Microlunatus flavus]|uniref:hypothetical protein n=1 Tax=Microlunatus flavus TaxID=1036181 RepID=UPI001113C246|nr:hypothetical protein [Microlunatus flavus]
MTDAVLAAADQAALQRRRFLRGGALLAAAAGGAVAASATGATPAQAAETDVSTLTVGLPPARFLDTRTSDGRELIVGSSSSAFDAKHRLKKGAWIDVAVFPTDAEGIGIFSVFVNLGSRASTKKGTLLVTEPDGGRSDAWTLHYGKGAEVNNSAIVGVGVDDSESYYTVRIYAGSVTHVVLDLTGVSALVASDPVEELRTARTSQRTSLARVVAAAKSMRR